MNNRFIRVISLILLIAIFTTFVPPVAQAKTLAYEKVDNKAQLSNGPNGKDHTYQELLEKDPSYQIDKALVQLENNIQRLETKLDQKTETGEEVKNLTSLKRQLEKVSQELQAQFDTTRQRLVAMGASATILKRNEQFVEQYKNNLEKTLRYIDEIANARDEQGQKDGLVKIREHISTKLKKQPNQELGNETLPFRSASPTEKSPIVGASLTPAYAGGGIVNTGGSLGLNPMEQDLAQTIEVAITSDIQELAEALNRDPVKIYNYVLNNIDFQIYYGSVKTAQQVLKDKAGNDIDQASLLIALLRASGIPARYVRGAVTLSQNQLINWVATKDNITAFLMLATAGYPVNFESQGISVDHTWVEAFIPYRNYRGKANDQTGKVWIPLDTSLKEYTFSHDKDITKESAFPWDEYLSQERSQSPVEYYEQKLTGYINSRYPGKQLNEFTFKKQIKKASYSILPSTTPFKVVEVYGEYTEIPDNLRQKIVIRSDGINKQLNISQISDKRMTVSYELATEEDAMIVEQYGGVDYTPSYLIKLKPVFKIEGEISAEGAAANVGERQSLYLDFISPSDDTDTVEKVMTAGDYYAIVLSPQGLNPEFVNARFQDTKYIYSRDRDNRDGEELFQLGLDYILTTEKTQKRLEDLMGMRVLHYTTAAFISYDKKYDYAFESAYSCRESGITIDVKRNMVSPFTVSGDTSSKKQFMMVAGLDGSYFEHEIYNTRYGLKGASTVKAIQLANQRGIPVYNINRNNLSQIIPSLQVSDYVKQSIINYANAGKEITIPGQEIEYYGTTIAGYIVMDPKSGAAGYLISGGAAGGKTNLVQIMSIGGAIKETALAGVIETVELSLKLKFPFREQGFYEAAAEGLVRGYISGFAGTVKSEWDSLKELPKMAKEIINFAWDYAWSSEFREKVHDDLKQLVDMLPEIWAKRSEIISAITNYYMTEVEDVARKSLNIGRSYKYFNDFAFFYGTGKAMGFLTVIFAESLIGIKVVTIFKDFIDIGKLSSLFKFFQGKSVVILNYILDIYGKGSQKIKDVMLYVVSTGVNELLKIRYLSKYKYILDRFTHNQINIHLHDVAKISLRFGETIGEGVGKDILSASKNIWNQDVQKYWEKSWGTQIINGIKYNPGDPVPTEKWHYWKHVKDRKDIQDMTFDQYMQLTNKILFSNNKAVFQAADLHYGIFNYNDGSCIIFKKTGEVYTIFKPADGVDYFINHTYKYKLLN